MSYSNTIFLSEVTEGEVLDILKDLSNKNSSGCDEIPCSLVRTVRRFIAAPLCRIINNSFQSGVFPAMLKIAKVVPIFKTGDPLNMKNYRPIPLLSVFSKVFEIAMHRRIVAFCEKYNVISNMQHGFRAKRSTETAIFEFTNAISGSLDTGNLTEGLFLGLSKAFDCIDHSILLSKISLCGPRGKCWDWISSYLSNRFQFVTNKYKTSQSIASSKSDPLPVTSGVPQGSVLGPLF